LRCGAAGRLAGRAGRAGLRCGALRGLDPLGFLEGGVSTSGGRRGFQESEMIVVE
jgi:hypothetical protein